MIKRFSFLLSMLFFFAIPSLIAQPAEQLVKILVAPDHTSWQYQPGEKVKFGVSVYQSGNLLKDVAIRYEIGPEKLKPVLIDSVFLKTGQIVLDAGTMKTAGFLRCVVTVMVNGKTYRGLATAGFAPLTIQPTVESPADFVSFWNKAKEELAGIPMDAKMVLLPDRSSEKVNVYHLSLKNIGNSRVYGILCVPKAPGKYPALLRVPGAGIRPYRGDIATAEKGIITLEIGIHGIPVNLDDEVYSNLSSGALNGYPSLGMDDKNRFYYKRVYLGCVRANDFLTSLPQYNGKRLGVCGGSQGGALSVITAALDERVNYLAAFYPALSDVTGYLKGRAGGWPHYFDDNNKTYNTTREKMTTIAYYDVVNFARNLKAEGYYAWGFNDEVCPPTSMYAAYNVIQAPKELELFLETGHWTFPEERDSFTNWITGKLLK
ncbi:MAG: acetylxylan esterase [Flavipsychrobacter sp.]|nr:acetylxylan esterase [Flavipsychrobacter sp.]